MSSSYTPVARDIELDVFQPPAAKRPCLQGMEKDDESVPQHKPYMSRLCDISNDCLTIITDYLEAHCIAKLVEIGSTVLCSRLYASTHRFELTSKEAHRWPTLVHRFYNLRHFALVNQQRYLNKRHAQAWELKLAKVASSLVSLKLSNIKICGGSLKGPSLHKLFPNLKSLDLQSVFVMQSRRSSDGEPVKAELVTGRFIASIASATYQQLSFLALPNAMPVKQEFLHKLGTSLHTLIIGRAQPGVDFSHLLGLQTLVTKQIQKHQAVIILPSALTELNLTLIRNPARTQDTPILPLSLTRLTLNTNLLEMKSCLSNQPYALPNLTEFVIDLHRVGGIDNELLTSLFRIAPNLQHISGSGVSPLEKDVDLSILPNSLKSIPSSFMTLPSQWKHVPKSCRVVEALSTGSYNVRPIISKNSFQYVCDLPNIVESVTLQGWNVLPARDWSGLTRVHYRGGLFSSKTFKSEEFFPSLPVTITWLDLLGSTFIPLDNTSLKRLVNLNTLCVTQFAHPTLTFTPEQGECSMYLDVWLSHLPPSISSLVLHVQDKWTCTDYDFSKCVWPTELNRLDLHIHQSNHSIKELQASFSTLRNISFVHMQFRTPDHMFRIKGRRYNEYSPPIELQYLTNTLTGGIDFMEEPIFPPE